MTYAACVAYSQAATSSARDWTQREPTHTHHITEWQPDSDVQVCLSVPACVSVFAVPGPELVVACMVQNMTDIFGHHTFLSALRHKCAPAKTKLTLKVL